MSFYYLSRRRQLNQVYSYIFTDGVMVGDLETHNSLKQMIITDTVYIPDVPVKAEESIMSDSIMTADISLLPLLRQRTLIDSLFTQDSSLKQEQHIFTDNSLLGDSSISQSLRQLLSLDHIFLSDTMEKRLEKIMQDRILLSDSLLKDVIKIFFDTLLLNDPVVTSRLLSGVFLDNLLTFDLSGKEMSKFIMDGLQLGDIQVKQLLKVILDKLSLLDSVDTQKNAILIQLILADGLLFNDFYTKIKEGVLVDGLLLSESKVVQLSKFFMESLLFSSTIYNELHKLIKENVLVGDSSLVQRIKQIQLLDAFMLSDVRLSEIQKSTMDSLSLSDQIIKMLSIIMVDELHIVDSTSMTTYLGIIAALVYARLKAVDLLSIQWGEEDLLGRILTTIDLLGREIGTGPKPRMDI